LSALIKLNVIWQNSMLPSLILKSFSILKHLYQSRYILLEKFYFRKYWNSRKKRASIPFVRYFYFQQTLQIDEFHVNIIAMAGLWAQISKETARIKNGVWRSFVSTFPRVNTCPRYCCTPISQSYCESVHKKKNQPPVITWKFSSFLREKKI